MPPEDLSKQFEEKLLKQISQASRRVKGVYDAAILDVARLSAIFKSNGQDFDISKHPKLKKEFERIVKEMQDKITAGIINSIEQSWELSNTKNDAILKDVLEGREVADEVLDLLYNHNGPALEAFTKRVEKGMNLSDRVWKLVEPYKFEMEATLTDGINRGRSAAEMATDMKKFLNDPDKLFRRVRDKETGKLKLSKAAREYKPGQGRYRSSYQNAIRLTSTETNIAYRSADHERWKEQTFTKGFEVKLSNNHPEYDICDQLKGQYPKDFKFTGWHPRCRCFAIPVLVSDDDFDKMEDELLGISGPAPKVDIIEKPPKGFDKYVAENKERIAGWKSKPYWLKDNSGYVGSKAK